jgi:thiamine biosynthesis protein ThiS
MILIQLNDQSIAIDQETNLEKLLHTQGYGVGGYAVLVNQKFISGSQYGSVALKADDVIEIIFPMQGG